MTPEEHRMLAETYNLAEENARILKGLQRTNRISIIFRVLYWMVIIGISFGAYYFIQPYVDTVRESYQSLIGQEL